MVEPTTAPEAPDVRIEDLRSDLLLVHERHPGGRIPGRGMHVLVRRRTFGQRTVEPGHGGVAGLGPALAVEHPHVHSVLPLDMGNGIAPSARYPRCPGVRRLGDVGVDIDDFKSLEQRHHSPNVCGRYTHVTAPVRSGRNHVYSGGPVAQRQWGEVTTLQNRPNTALLVVDVQTGVVEGAHRRDAVVANVGSLVERARQERVPVVWVQHCDEGLARGSDGWRIVPELTPHDTEPLVEKSFGDSFEDTGLEAVLAGLGVGRLIVAGAQTDACIRSTLHGAFVRGYDTMLVGDAHTTEDLTQWGAPSPDQVIAHTNLYWSYQAAPGRTAGTVETKDVNFGVTS